MRRRTLVALGGRVFTPTDDQRRMVVAMQLNGSALEAMAAALKITTMELRYHFQRELDLGVDVVMAQAAQNIISLANQTEDKGVALRANQAILAPRAKPWREPPVEAQVSAGNLDDLTLAEVEAQIERLERRRRAAVAPEGETETVDPDETQPA
jgi:AcrR family transcriptional regulator